ncbi:Terminase small subunit [Desulfovibrio sp. X2]|uniref:terminase small subunit n=1 Tax=Desulfovibrio sp. X2 TaxID=941449 RepID=UPI00035882A0|nr:terminase small subunit [Desulfovibrio sp. X2]EPR42714.1 Terminase small subunit [Desulfovibrio sp. X2]
MSHKITEDTPMTAAQARFVSEYLVDLNGTQAAIRAGYSARRADRTAVDLLAKPNVAKAVREAMAARQQRTEVTQDMVVAELARVAFGDPRRVMKWGPGGVELKDSEKLTADEAALVSEVRETRTKEGGSLGLKTCDKLKALELLGRHLAMFTDKVDANVKGELDVKTMSDGELSGAFCALVGSTVGRPQ